MSDTTLNRILCYGTHAERLAFTPSQPSLSGTGPGDYINVLWTESDTGGHLTYAWNQAGSAWVQISAGNASTDSIGITIGDGTNVITTGTKGFIYIPRSGTITANTVLSSDSAVTSGSIVIDIWKVAYASYPPTVTNTITASAKPTLSSATHSQDTTLSGWTTAISAGDVVAYHVDSVTSLKQVTLVLTVAL